MAWRTRRDGSRWWHPTCFLGGIGIAIAAVTSPLDALGESESMIAHVTQHVILADFAAPLLLLGLTPAMQRPLARGLARVQRSRGRLGQLAAFALSPVGGFTIWTVGTYVWLVPPLHRAAVPDGPLHALDHTTFLVLGLFVWIGAFDPRPATEWRRALRCGGLPWWARHVYAMVTRLTMLPAAFLIWLAPVTAYHRGADPPGPYSVEGDLERAASVMIGFEMLLGGLAVVLAFVFVSVHEGRERARTL